MLIKNNKTYLVSYAELRRVLGINEEIVYITSSVTGEKGDFETSYGIEIGVKDEN